MRYLLLLPFLLFSGCSLLERIDAAVVEQSILAGSDFISGNPAAGIGKSVDILLILLGLKGAQKGTQLAKAKLAPQKKKKA